MPIKHRAEYDGITFKRTSASRRYSHVTIVPVSLAENLARAEESARRDWATNQAFHKREAAGILHRPSWATDAEYQKWIDRGDKVTPEQQAEAQAWLDGGEAGLVADARARTEARWRKVWPHRDEAWGDAGWSSSYALARKNANRFPGAIILEAVIL